MLIIKKFILKEWFKSFFSSFTVLFILVTIAKLIGGFLRSSVTPQEVLINYALELPKWVGMILPLSCMVASLFSLNKLKSRSELIAIFAAGFSRKAFIFIVVQASLVVALFQLFNSSFLDPISKRLRHNYAAQTLTKFRHDKGMGLKTSSLDSGRIWYKSGNYFFSYVGFDKASNVLKEVSYYKLSGEHKIEETFRAKEARYVKDKVWKLIKGSWEKSLANQEFPTSEKFNYQSLELNESISDFKQIDADISTLSVWPLIKFILKIRKSGIASNEYEILLYQKFSSALICIIFALLSITPIFHPNRRHSSFGKSVGLTFVFALAYWLINTSTLALGQSGKVPPALATFSIPLIFSTYIGMIFYKNRNLS